MKQKKIIGMRPVMEALESGVDIEKILIQKGLQGDLYKEVLAQIKAKGIQIQMVPAVALSRHSNKAHQGIIALVSMIEYADLDNLIAGIYESGDTPKLLFLDHVTDVGNFGAICRSAECFGIHGVIIPSKGMAPVNEVSIKRSAGALLNIPIAKIQNVSSFLTSLSSMGIQTVALTEKGNMMLSETDFSLPTCLIMGNEETGISSDVFRKSDVLAKINMSGKTSSLNVSAACAIACYTLQEGNI